MALKTTKQSGGSLLDLLVYQARSLLLDPSYGWLLAALVVAGDALLTQMIIRFIPCESRAAAEGTAG